MLNMDRKTYEEPSLQELGAMKDITENGSQTFSDTFQGQDGTAFDVGSWFSKSAVSNAPHAT